MFTSVYLGIYCLYLYMSATGGIHLMSDFGITISHFINLVGLIVVTIGVMKAVFATLKDEWGIITHVKPLLWLLIVIRIVIWYVLEKEIQVYEHEHPKEIRKEEHVGKRFKKKDEKDKKDM